jgi:hypothetical protein
MNELFQTFHNLSSGGMYMFFTHQDHDVNVRNGKLQQLYNEWIERRWDPGNFLGQIDFTSQDQWNQFNFPRICRLCDDPLLIPRMCDLMRTWIAFHDEDRNRGESRCGHIREEDWDNALMTLMDLKRQACDFFANGQVDAHQRSCAAFCRHFHRFLIKCQNDMNLFVNRQMWILIWRSRDLARDYTTVYQWNHGHGLTGVLLDLFDAWGLLRCVHQYVETATIHGLPSLCTLWTGSPDFVTLYAALNNLQLSGNGMEGVNADILRQARTDFNPDMYRTDHFYTLWGNETQRIERCIQEVFQNTQRNVQLVSGDRNMPIHNEGLMYPRDAHLFNSAPAPAYPGQLLLNHGLLVYYFSILE